MLVAAATLLAPALFAQTAQLTVDASNIVSPVSSTLYGLMTEEINHSYEGGLYAELVQNRTFHSIWSGVEGWSTVRNGNARAQAMLDKTNGPSTALPFSYKLTVERASHGNEAGISNPGWYGMAVRSDTTYAGSFYAQLGGSDPGPLTVQLVSDDTGAMLASATVALHTGAWSQYSYTLHTGMLSAPPTSRNHLELTLAQPGTVSFQLISLFPPTYNNRPGGFRTDIMERMAAMHPHFLRLPGGNYLEGDRIQDRFQWKQTIGPMVDRPGHQAPWTYWSSDGLGLLEFLEWCEDLKIEPLLAVYAGYSLKGEHIATDKLDPYIQDALDEVEYVTGDASTKWGAQRARDGHPAPFVLHYIEIGNEDWLDHSGSYEARYPPFALALRKAYPQYKLIATTPLKHPPAGAEPDLIDDHYYKSPADMLAFTHHYDATPRNGPKIFIGEWATRSGSPTPNFGDALGDAALMTSMERNSDLIQLAAYAPLLVNVSSGGMQWSTDLIGFDALTTYASPSYYAQALFASHLGEGTAKSTLTGAGDLFFLSATVSQATHTLHLKLVNAATTDQTLSLTLSGLGSGAKTATVQSLHGATFLATNSIDRPDAIHPIASTAKLRDGQQSYTVPALTIQVIDVPVQ